MIMKKKKINHIGNGFSAFSQEIKMILKSRRIQKKKNKRRNKKKMISILIKLTNKAILNQIIKTFLHKIINNNPKTNIEKLL